MTIQLLCQSTEIKLCISGDLAVQHGKTNTLCVMDSALYIHGQMFGATA